MGMAIPYLQKLQKDGESGRKTLNQITRWLTIGVCLVQAPFYLGTITQVFYLTNNLDLRIILIRNLLHFMFQV